MSISKIYIEEMHDEFGALATWPPNQVVRLGDVGIVSKSGFERRLTLRDLPGITPKAMEESSLSPPIELFFTSRDGVVIQAAGGANSPTPDPEGAAKTDVNVTFRRGNATLFAARGCREKELVNLGEIERCVLALAKATTSQWHREYLIVTRVTTVDQVTILVANSAGAKVTLEVGVGVGQAPAELASARASFAAGASSSIGVQVVGESRLTPLFVAHQLRTRFFGGPELTRRGVGEGEGAPTDTDLDADNATLQLVSPDDLAAD